MTDLRRVSAQYPSLSERHVLLTGGADGIGASIVKAFCHQRSRVTFLDINDIAAKELIHSLADEGLQTLPTFIRCDVTNNHELKDALAQASEQNGAIDVLVNNAACDEREDWREITEESWDWMLRVNLRHYFFASQAVAATMVARGGGSIINMGSIAWKIGSSGMPAYLTAKSAIIGLTRSLARDLGPHNIRVNSVLPGWVMTRRQVEKWLTPDAETILLQSQCLKRKLTAEDVSPMVLFLAANDSAACTSQGFVVDAGWSE